MRSSGAHGARTLAVEAVLTAIALGEEDWRDTWRRGFARHLAKRIGEEEKEKEIGEEEKKEKQTAQTSLIKSSNSHLAGKENKDFPNTST